MTSLNSAIEMVRTMARKEAKKMFPSHVDIDIHFDRDIKAESDGYMRPIYLPNGRVKFNITFNTDLIQANLKNLKSDGMKGLIVHELAHAYDFLVDKPGFMKAPHKNKVFTSALAREMNAKKGSLAYKAAMQPDVSTACALKKCTYRVAPAWLSNYWLYFCKKCGYYDSYVTDLRAKQPVCENCGSHNLIVKKMPVELAAKMDQAVSKNPKAFDTDAEIKRYILKELKSEVNKKDHLLIEDYIKHKKWLKSKKKQ